MLEIKIGNTTTIHVDETNRDLPLTFIVGPPPDITAKEVLDRATVTTQILVFLRNYGYTKFTVKPL